MTNAASYFAVPYAGYFFAGHAPERRMQVRVARLRSAGDDMDAVTTTIESDRYQGEDIPLGALALGLVKRFEKSSDNLLVVMRSERRMSGLVAALRSLAPACPVLSLPRWDCVPYDRAPPSRDSMGRRIATLVALADRDQQSAIVVTSPEALLQRVPPRSVWQTATRTIVQGEELDTDGLKSFLLRVGYILDDRVDETGEVAIRGAVLDIFPPGAALPIRIDHQDGKVDALWTYEPLTQMTSAACDRLRILPVSEAVLPDEREEGEARFSGIEHWLPDLYDHLETVFDYLPGPSVILDERAEERGLDFLQQVADAYETAASFRRAGESGRAAMRPDGLYLGEQDWRKVVAHDLAQPLSSLIVSQPVQQFARLANPASSLRGFIDEQAALGRRVVLTAPSGKLLDRMVRLAAKDSSSVLNVGSWSEISEAPAGAVITLRGSLDHGFVDADENAAFVAASDVFGRRGTNQSPDVRRDVFGPGDASMRNGDVVVHVDHGLALLRGIETIRAAEGMAEDTLVLEFADAAKLMVPAAEIGRIWRYGGDADAVALDRLGGTSWPKRRAELARDLRKLAEKMLALAREREGREAPAIVPEKRRFQRFVEGFPFEETPDQASAIEDVLQDLASGRPMDRLVCGDVGYGKTEVALRAAAAAVLAGKQVAIAAPTTVLVRQHVATFRRRFAGLGIEIAQLSRLVGAAEARSVRQGVASGDTRIVVGTHALAGKQVSFKELGLVVIDEEHRFGAKQKEKLRQLASGLHVLTLTATPIPRTLESALVGIQDVSVIATPPSRRLPIRTFVTPFDPVSVRAALLRERTRGGQSFVVCPRIEDIGPMSRKLSELVPELQVMVAHGKLPPAEMDAVMVDFADGAGDVLLATNIIESGLDVPRANTMLIWRADRFGIAQLHQLRGRVGRGRLRGTAYLLTEPEAKLSPATEKRLKTLEAFDRLGSGFALSARDLDHRGAGDLVGEEQAGHMRLIGADLYQHLLFQAVKQARGEEVDDEWAPELHLGLEAYVPEDYVPEPELRIDLHLKLARMPEDGEEGDLEAEIEDRFGPLPLPVRNLIALRRLARACRRAGIAKLEAGPEAIAMTPRRAVRGAAKKLAAASGTEIVERDGRLIVSARTTDPDQRRDLALRLVEELSAAA